MSATAKFLAEFAKITGTGSFHSSGTAPFFLPGIHVEGVGELAFPLPASQAEALRAHAETAPYGKGERTIRDENVRQCWQIDAARIEFRSREWPKFLAQIAGRICEDLGIGGRISLHPYKLLLYEKGGHFLPHRDTEKLDAMIGSLIVALPSAHKGGRLCIRHDGREAAVDFGNDAHLHEFQYAAFFADCEHEVEPVRSGWRCCLAFNLRLEEGDPDRLNLSLTAQSRALLPAVVALKNERAGELTAVLLEHHYTEANLSWRNLKGSDPSKAKALAAAAREAGCIAHLALVTFHQSGQLEGGYDYDRHHRDDDDPPDGTMGEVFEERLTIDHWRDAQDRPASPGCYLIEPDAMISREKINAADPDEEEFEGYSGNEGCTMDYWYRRAAIVLWPEEDDERVRAQYDLVGACGHLAELAVNEPGGPAFRRLAEAVIECFPDALPYHLSNPRGVAESTFATTLNALAAVGAAELFERLAARVAVSAFHLCDVPLWRKLHKTFGIAVCERLIEQTDDEETAGHRRMFFDLLDALGTKKDAAPLVRRIAGRLVTLAPEEKQKPHWGLPPEPKPPGNPDEMRILLAVSHLLESKASRTAALAFLLADRSLIYVREILGPVLLDLGLQVAAAPPNSLMPEALAFARKTLDDEIARPLEPYPDWARPFPEVKAVEGPLIRELAAFVADPAARTYSFKRDAGGRSEVESFIRTHHLDLDCKTEKEGRPYTLVCTKNAESYRRKRVLRAREIELSRKLAAL